MTEPENGKIFSDALEPDQEYTYGQVVQFECNSGYMLDGPKQIHCSAGGVWSAETPKCVGKINLLTVDLINCMSLVCFFMKIYLSKHCASYRI